MLNMNFTGNLGKDAETRAIQSGDKVTSFSVGVKVGFGDRQKTQWVNCAFWGDRGEKVAPYLKKGTLVAITGTPSTRAYIPNNGGDPRAELQCSVGQLDLLGGRGDGEARGGDQGGSAGDYRSATSGGGGYGNAPDDLDDSIPFVTSGGIW